jgi:hypothetical protein
MPKQFFARDGDIEFEICEKGSERVHPSLAK